MGKTIRCEWEGKNFPASQFIETRYGRVHNTLSPHNENGTQFVIADDGRVAIRPGRVPHPVAKLKLKMQSIKSRAKIGLMFKGK